ncbi:MAG TPA: hypothetical protein VNL94_06005 [Candidatus Binatia bacterium]|nr:hypothetical protein [Candidatus Binatia bacterium]
MKTQRLRVVGTVMWFVAAWSGAGFFAGIAGLPSALALVAALLVAMIVWFDPTGRIWGQPRPTRRVRPIEDVAAELDQRAGRGAAEPVEQPTP